MAMPKVSVIIPVYNVAPYLRQCLDSFANQTLRDIEIVCVDDGSTDGGAAIMAEYAARDSRVKVLTREHTNAGAARNAGMSAATGEWLFFSDADDFSGAEMLSRITTANGADVADIVVAGHRTLEDGRYSAARLPRRFVLRHNAEDGACPSHLFLDAGVMPWNKLFRRAFISRYGIAFQEIPRHNDMRFVCFALAAADCIAVSDTCGYVYRRGRRDSVTSNRGAAFMFADVLLSLRTELERHGIFQKSAGAYCNLALAHCCYHLLGEFDAEHFSTVFSGLHSRMFAELGLKDIDESVFINRKHYRYMMAILADETPLSLWMLLLRERYADWRELVLRSDRIKSQQKDIGESNIRLQALENKVRETGKAVADLNRKLSEAGLREKELERLADVRLAQIEQCNSQLTEKDGEMKRLRNELSGTQARLCAAENSKSELSRRLGAVLASRSYRLGCALTWPFRLFCGPPRHMDFQIPQR